MRTVLDKSTRDELINRVRSLDEKNKAQWGRMNVSQMLKHCTLADELFLGKLTVKRVFLGRLIGRMALKRMLRDERPMAHNAPTNAAFRVKGDYDVPAEKAKWISLIEEYGRFSNDNFEHWFFGKMTKEQVGYFVFKHDDHHLRQFNC